MVNRNKRYQAWDPDTMERLRREIPLPDKIKCGRCNKYRLQAAFSGKQLTDARQVVRSNGPNARYNINCQACSNSRQVVEIECTGCHKTKGLEDFAKSQRKKPDCAKCFACIEDQLDTDAIQEGFYEDPENLFETVSRRSDNYPDYFTTVSNSSDAGDWDVKDDARSDNSDSDSYGGGISLSHAFLNAPSVDETLIESEYNHGGDKVKGSAVQSSEGGWNEVVRAKSWHTKSTPSASSGFDRNKYGNPAGRSTASSVSGSTHTFNSTIAERSDIVSNKGGFAKIKAYKPPKEENTVEEEAWESESSEESDDDSDDGSDIVI